MALVGLLGLGRRPGRLRLRHRLRRRTRTFSRGFGSFRRCAATPPLPCGRAGRRAAPARRHASGGLDDHHDRAAAGAPGAGRVTSPTPPAAVMAATMAAPSLNATSGTAGVGAAPMPNAVGGGNSARRARARTSARRQASQTWRCRTTAVEPGPADTGGVGGERGRQPRAVGAVHGCRGGGDDRAAMVGQYALDDAFRHLEASRDLRAAPAGGVQRQHRPGLLRQRLECLCERP